MALFSNTKFGTAERMQLLQIDLKVMQKIGFNFLKKKWNLLIWRGGEALLSWAIIYVTPYNFYLTKLVVEYG